MDYVLIIYHALNLPNNASIDHHSLACYFFSKKLILWKVCRHCYAMIYKSKVLFYLTPPKLANCESATEKSKDFS